MLIFWMYMGTSLALVVVGMLARALKVLPAHQADGVTALSQVITTIAGAFLLESLQVAIASSAAAAYFAWLWWKGGGDDDTKRRLRSAARRFRGVRRTASAGA